LRAGDGARANLQKLVRTGSLVKLVLALVPLVLAIPVLLLLAVALGPVILGILCAGLFGLIVFALWSGAMALGLLGRRAGQRLQERRAPGSRD
jgi:hypothetical protein